MKNTFKHIQTRQNNPLATLKHQNTLKNPKTPLKKPKQPLKTPKQPLKPQNNPKQPPNKPLTGQNGGHHGGEHEEQHAEEEAAWVVEDFACLVANVVVQEADQQTNENVGTDPHFG